MFVKKLYDNYRTQPKYDTFRAHTFHDKLNREQTYVSDSSTGLKTDALKWPNTELEQFRVNRISVLMRSKMILQRKKLKRVAK